MNKSLERIRDEFAKDEHDEFSGEKYKQDSDYPIGYYDGICTGFTKAIETLRCETCKNWIHGPLDSSDYASKCNLLGCCVDGDFGCIDWGSKESKK